MVRVPAPTLGSGWHSINPSARFRGQTPRPSVGGVTPEQVQELASAAGAALLAAADSADPDPLRATSALRSAFPSSPPELVAAALTQVRLRRRGLPRLGPDAASVLLTVEGLEQATRGPIAAARAERLAASARVVADLGCGIGTESWAMARAGLAVRAVEIDPVVADIARHNAEALGLADRITVITGDLTDPELLDSVLDGVDAAFLDPARREPDGPRRIDGVTSRRLLAPEQWSPPWSFIQSLAARLPIAVKVAPGFDTSYAPDADVVFTSHDGDLVDACVWFDKSRSRGRRTAMVMRGENAVVTLKREGGGLPDVPVSAPMAYLLDPDDAIVRAGVISMILGPGGALLDPRVAYVTREFAPAPGEKWLGTWYEVLAHMPFNIREVRWALAEMGIGNVTIAKRAFAGDVDDVRKQLRLSGKGRSATLVLTRTDAGPLALICSLVEH
jgi:SAM-dependent methyltransferase